MVDSKGVLRSLEELDLCAHKRCASTELLLAVIADLARRVAATGQDCLPPWFLPERPSMRKGIHKGFRFVLFLSCGSPGPHPACVEDEPRCAAPMLVRGKDGSPNLLFMDLSLTVPHVHKACECVKTELHIVFHDRGDLATDDRDGAQQGCSGGILLRCRRQARERS